MSSEAADRFMRDLELYTNKQAAETVALRTILQVWVVSMLSRHPEGASLFAGLRREVAGQLDARIAESALDPTARQGSQLARQSADNFFAEMAPVFAGQVDPSSASH